MESRYTVQFNLQYLALHCNIFRIPPLKLPDKLSIWPDRSRGGSHQHRQLSACSAFASLPARLWVLGQMGAARLSFMQMPEVGFCKLCGSGTGQGFTPRPNTAVWAILATWPDAETARHRLSTAPVYRRWHARATEAWTILLEPTSSRGLWSGQHPSPRPTRQTPARSSP